MKSLSIVLLIVGVEFAYASVVSNAAVQNGNCNYNNGYISENGVTRLATTEENRQIEAYQKEMSTWAELLSTSITDEVDRKVHDALSSKSHKQSRIGVSRRPVAPKAPCLCSLSACQNNNVNIISESGIYSGPSDNRQEQFNNQNNQRPQNRSGHRAPAGSYDDTGRPHVQTQLGQTSHVNENVAVHNGNCNYNNGYVIENGVSRLATSEENGLIKAYQSLMSTWAESLSTSISDEVDTIVHNALSSKSHQRSRIPKNRRPEAPKAPCLCSEAVCENNNVNIISSGGIYSGPSDNQQTQDRQNYQIFRNKSGNWTPARPYSNTESQPAQELSRQAYNPSSHGTRDRTGYQYTADRERQRYSGQQEESGAGRTRTNQDRSYNGRQKAYDGPTSRSREYDRVPTSRNDNRYEPPSIIQRSEGKNNVNLIDYGSPTENARSVDSGRSFDNRRDNAYANGARPENGRNQPAYQGDNSRAARRQDDSDEYGRQSRKNENSNIQRSVGRDNVISISK